jgi:hypothetical protein
VPLDSSCILLWIDTIVFYWMELSQQYATYLSAMETTSSVGVDCQLDG